MSGRSRQARSLRYSVRGQPSGLWIGISPTRAYEDIATPDGLRNSSNCAESEGPLINHAKIDSRRTWRGHGLCADIGDDKSADRDRAAHATIAAPPIEGVPRPDGVWNPPSGWPRQCNRPEAPHHIGTRTANSLDAAASSQERGRTTKVAEASIRSRPATRINRAWVICSVNNSSLLTIGDIRETSEFPQRQATDFSRSSGRNGSMGI